MTGANEPKISWVDPELLRLKQEEKELFEEAHIIFHVIFAFAIISLVVFLLLLTILVLLHRLIVHFLRKRSLSKLLEKQAAASSNRREASLRYCGGAKNDPEQANLCSCSPLPPLSAISQKTSKAKPNLRAEVFQATSDAKIGQEHV